MAGIANKPNSPRQKMINLMYLVFIAMMALNVSVEVLDGFELVEDSLQTSINNTTNRNNLINQEMESYYASNPDKASEWYAKAQRAKMMSDDLYRYMQSLKVKIILAADGSKADTTTMIIDHKDDLEAASRVMLAPIQGEGKKLREAIDSYRLAMGNMVDDDTKTALLEAALSTEPPKKGGNRTWEQTLFENMPATAAITLLTKLQSDLRSVEGEMLSYLLNSVDMGDYRVNQMKPQVIPKSQIVMRGTPYQAEIVLSAVDTTKRPKIVINGTELPESSKGFYSVNTSATGTFPIEGYLEQIGPDGNVITYEFKDEYYVTEPNATVAPTRMNMLYAGIDNPIQIAVPGVPSGNITATMTNGQLTRTSGDMWNAIPTTVGTDAVINISARMAEGGLQINKTFHVRALPDPTIYILYADQNGNERKFKGGALAKRSILNAGGIKAAIDDGVLDIEFDIISFQMIAYDSYRNAIPTQSDGPRFSNAQREQINNMTRGKDRFFITNTKVRGRDGTERTLQAMEVIVN